MTSGSDQEQLQDEIEELRGELGQTIEELVHKVDLPARARERSSELREQAVERAGELRERGGELLNRAVERGGELRDRAREVTTRRATEYWPTMAAASAAVIALFIIVRRVRAR